MKNEHSSATGKEPGGAPVMGDEDLEFRKGRRVYTNSLSAAMAVRSQCPS